MYLQGRSRHYKLARDVGKSLSTLVMAPFHHVINLNLYEIRNVDEVSLGPLKAPIHIFIHIATPQNIKNKIMLISKNNFVRCGRKKKSFSLM